MSDALQVNTAGLRAGAARSEQLAGELTAPSTGAQGSGASTGGVAAVTAAITHARRALADAVTGHVASVRDGANEYDRTDDTRARSFRGMTQL